MIFLKILLFAPPYIPIRLVAFSLTWMNLLKRVSLLQKRTEDLHGPQKFACGAYKHSKQQEHLEISIYTAGGDDKMYLRSDPPYIPFLEISKILQILPPYIPGYMEVKHCT